MKRRFILVILPLSIIAIGAILVTRRPPLSPDHGPTVTGEPPAIDIESDPRLLIQRSLEAYGGIDLIERIDGLKLESAVTLHRKSPDPLQGRAVEYYRFPDRLRTDITVEKRTRTHIYDGLNAWTIEGGWPRRGADYVAEGLRTSIRNIPILLLQEALDERSILDPIELDRLDGRPTYVVPFNDSGGAQCWLWFDPETYLLERLDYTLLTSRGPSAMQVRMDDYRIFDGVQTATLFTFISDGSITQETRVESAVYNPELPDSLFSAPAVEE